MNIYFNLFNRVVAGHKVVVSVPTLITMIRVVTASGDCGDLAKRSLVCLEDILRINDTQVSDFVEFYRWKKGEYCPLTVKRSGFYRWVKEDYRRWCTPRDRR